jgi:hypothetical protein
MQRLGGQGRPEGAERQEQPPSSLGKPCTVRPPRPSNYAAEVARARVALDV